MVKFIGHSKEKIVSKKKQKRDIISFTQEKYQVGCSVFVHQSDTKVTAKTWNVLLLISGSGICVQDSGLLIIFWSRQKKIVGTKML